MLSFHSRHTLALLGPSALLLFAVPAGAQVAYTDRTLFNAANPGLASFNFGDLPAADRPPADGFLDVTPNYTFQGVGFSTSNTSAAGLFVLDKGYYASIGTPYALDGTDFLQAATGNPTQLDITLPTGTTAFGANFGAFEAPRSVQVLVNGQALPVPLVTTNSNGGRFFGYTSLDPITSLSLIEQTGNSLNVNDVEFGQATPAAVPEASSLVELGLLLALGTLTVSAHKNRRGSVPTA
jgi:hypothetical protein